MKYHQLKPAAQERARQWFKDSEAEMWGSDRAPDYYEDMATCLKFLGITVDCENTTQRRTVNGQERTWQRTEWGFEWSGFWSQGDGLVFKGSWDASDVDMAGLQGYAPKDQTLKRIAIQMTAILLRWPEATATITTVSYGGLPGMHVDEAYVGTEGPDGPDISMPNDDYHDLKAQIAAAAHWCYKLLEDNYESDTGDEAAVEGIEANEYDFDRDGNRITCSRPRRQVVGATSCPAGAAA